MHLSLRSGIDQEITWSLDRLTRLCNNEQWVLRSIPGVLDSLFEWPEWYATEGYKQFTELQALFCTPSVLDQRRRHAVMSIFILRNASLNEQNCQDIAAHSHTLPLILKALHNLDFELDHNAEFVLHAIELLHFVGGSLVLSSPSAPPATRPVRPLERIAGTSSNRSMIIASLTTLSLILSIPQNFSHIEEGSLALQAAVRYLPLLKDTPLVEACLNYLYVHLSQPTMCRAFMHNPNLFSVLRLLTSILISEQLEDTVTEEISGPNHTRPLDTGPTQNHELTEEELNKLLEMQEPERSYEWSVLQSFRFVV
jgi:chromatin structure-remodeling complex subunit RSC9